MKYFPRVLLYHTIGNYDWRISVPEKSFIKQMKIIKKLGLKVYSARDALAILKKKGFFERNSLILTFDDGYRDNYEVACPILGSFGLTATFFISVNYINKTSFWNLRSAHIQNMLTQRQITRMSRNGFEIGSHGLSHHNLVRLSRRSLLAELNNSKKFLGDIAGRDIISFSYPFGFFDRRVRREVRKLYQISFAVEEGVKDGCFDRFAIRRININQHVDRVAFEKILVPHE